MKQANAPWGVGRVVVALSSGHLCGAQRGPPAAGEYIGVLEDSRIAVELAAEGREFTGEVWRGAQVFPLKGTLGPEGNWKKLQKRVD